MAVLARSSITLVTSVDIDSVYWFYILQASTAAAPSVPTTAPATKGDAPSGWSKTEPTTVDINKTLYRIELTYFTDGTWAYSTVNQVSSYEAAKVAYNKADTVQTNLDTIQAQYGYKYKTDIIIYGDSTSTYYPVYFGYGDQNVPREVFITRSYSERAPDDWNTATHKGSLILRIKANYGGWGGATYKVEILDFSEMYSTLFADVQVSKMSGYGMAVWLRGGGTTGAIYHVYSDQQIVRVSTDNNFHANLPYIGYEAGTQFGWNGGTEANPTYKFVTDAPLTAPKTDRIKSLQSIVTATEAKSDAAAAQSTANTANSTANSAKTTATAAQTTANTAKTTADEAKTAATTATNTANSAKTAADNALINTKYNGPVNVGAAVTANRLIMNTTTAANTAASYKMVTKNTAYNIESPILYSATALSTGNIALANHTCYLIGNVNITGQGGASSLTVNNPVFLKGTLSGSTFTTVNDATFITQTQPTSSDNYHYIFLGTATSTTNVMLQAEHPLYMFIGGSFHRLGSSSDKILQTWVGGASVAIADAKLNGSYIQANTVTADKIYVEDLNALGATIGGFEIGSNSIHTAGSSSSDTAENAIWLCGYAKGEEDGFTRSINGTSRGGLVFAIGGSFGVDYDGWIYASNANIAGTITATGGEIGGFTIDSTSIHTKNVAVTSNASNSVALSSSTFTRTIGETSRSSLKFAIGSNFGVSNTGILYAGSAVINGSSTFNGSITATTIRTSANIGYSAHAFNLHRWDHVVVCSLNGCTASELNINGNNVGNGFKPINEVWFAVVIKDNANKWHLGCCRITTSGAITVYVYYEYNNTNVADWTNADCTFFGSTSWFTNDSTYPSIGV